MGAQCRFLVSQRNHNIRFSIVVVVNVVVVMTVLVVVVLHPFFGYLNMINATNIMISSSASVYDSI